MGKTKVDGSSEIVELRVLGDRAYIRNRIDMTATPPNGEPVQRSGYTLTLLRKESDSRWRAGAGREFAGGVGRSIGRLSPPPGRLGRKSLSDPVGEGPGLGGLALG